MKSAWTVIGGTAIAGSAALALACASTQIGNPDDYEPVSLSRVVPYPSEQELAGQRTRILLVASYTKELSKDEVGPAVTAVQESLEHYLSEAGADVTRPGDDQRDPDRDEARAAEPDDLANHFGDADWALVVRVTRFEHSSTYASPTSLFKNEEELRGEPGTCTHIGEVEVDLLAYRAPERKLARTRFKLRQTDDFSEKQFDDDCPISDSRKQVLLDDILNDAIPCLEIPIENRFSPHGYVLEQRSNEAASQQIYKTSLGRRNGAKPGLELAIFRVQHMTTADGHETRDERKIAEGIVTNQTEDDHSWISLKPRSLKQPLLAGDLVRGVYSDTLAAGLGLGKCKRILTAETVDGEQ